ncbi:MAG: ribulose-phosphate 3-epimerase [Oscillospiraceae bacterium]|jgi:ribulose-phosphate 3-epimerase
MRTFVSASILSADFSKLECEIHRAEKSGADMIHFDVMDGIFVNNISFGVPVLKSVKKCTLLPFDVHLMINEPLRFIKPFAEAGADIITFHAEAGSDVKETIDLIHSFGIKAGISVKPATPLSEIIPYLDNLELVLVMTVEPGFGGQGLIASTLKKISELRRLAFENNYNISIQVDGGINGDTAQTVLSAGADNLVSGSYLFGAENMKAAVLSLRPLL